MSSDAPLLVITGPTASGKTARAVDCARAFGGEIISADSRQLYRGMDLGTGKDLEEYGEVPYHLIDVRPAGCSDYTLYEYLTDASAAIDDVGDRGRLPILCGGTGMYVEAVLNDLRLPRVPRDEQLRAELAPLSLDELTARLASMKRLHNTTDTDTPARAIRAIEIATYYAAHPDEAELTRPRPRTGAVVVGVDIPRDVRRARITDRLHRRLDAGMVAEVEGLLASGVPAENLLRYGLEYKYLTEYVLGRTTRDEMVSGLETAIHQFAKRQMTWFRGMERRGHRITWLPYDMEPAAFVEAVAALLPPRP
ncbi:MAG: tRNA (adenosine(37)-N6)-dimethylallyltransferase MiaA [Bacteroides sp.]|nr:tRNA (adenosine(37)-N6)-dimethylallyltransferase MiaA [Bacteroides sp.]